VENFVIKFQNEETMKKWATGLDTQRKKQSAPLLASSPEQATPDFTWMQGQMGDLENPYAQNEDDEEDDNEYAQRNQSQPQSQYGTMAGTMPRNASTTSLRGRSTTGESIQSMAGLGRAPPPPRFPLPQPPGPLSVQTGGQSPGFRQGDSYFSPVVETPVSSRTSTTSSIFPPSAGYAFPKTGQPYPGGWDGEMNRYTAPAMPRAPSRDGPSPVNADGMVNGRNPRGPSMPVMASHSAHGAQMSRSRSYSTPDIQGPPGVRRTPGGSQNNVPAVPGIPAHLAHGDTEGPCPDED
jgi:cell division control protein 24